MADKTQAEVPDAGAVQEQLEGLRRENELLVALLEAGSELLGILGTDGRLLRTFRSRGRPLGYEPNDIEGRGVLDLVHPEDAEVALAALARLGEGPGTTIEVQLRLRRQDGTWVPMECLAENRVHDPIVRGVVVRARDVSGRLELERKLRLSQRMESVGRVASGIIHDFNNLLAVIRLHVGKLQAATAEPPISDAAATFAEIAKAAERGASLTKRLLAFVRDRPAWPRPVDLGAFVAAQEPTLRSLLPPEVQLVIATASPPLPVVVDPTDIEHVLLNLVFNARDALSQGGTVRVETRADHNLDGSPGCAILEVHDDGHGMDESTRLRAFEPFFTTKTAERGTGLGLWTVEDVVSRHGGSVAVQSAPGRGASFRVQLPLVPVLAPRPPAPVPMPRTRSSLCILLVDDEQALRDLLADELAASGHTVHTARDGVSALDLVDQSALTPDVLVTDLSMPRLGGMALSARLRERWPALPVVLVSGHGEAQKATHDDVNTVLLAKPFAVEELFAAIQLLAAAPK